MYEIYEIIDKKLIKEIIELDPYQLLNFNDYLSLKVEVDYEEKKAFINLGELYVFVDYVKTAKLLGNK